MWEDPTSLQFITPGGSLVSWALLLLGTTVLIRPLQNGLKELSGKTCGLVLRAKI